MSTYVHIMRHGKLTDGVSLGGNSKASSCTADVTHRVIIFHCKNVLTGEKISMFYSYLILEEFYEITLNHFN
jgi:hypothetical protein